MLFISDSNSLIDLRVFLINTFVFFCLISSFFKSFSTTSSVQKSLLSRFLCLRGNDSFSGTATSLTTLLAISYSAIDFICCSCRFLITALHLPFIVVRSISLKANLSKNINLSAGFIKIKELAPF